MPSSRPAPRSVLSVSAFSTGRAELLIYGDIGESWSSSSVTAAEVVEQLGALEGVTEIAVRINSYGGSVADGLAIYSALRRHPARKIVSIDGIAASIASLIAMAGDVVQMPASSLLMIHAPWSTATGNAEELRKFAEQLDGWASAMAEAYSAKTGAAVPAMVALLSDGVDHWYTGREAVAAGFADELLELAADDVSSDGQVEIDAESFATGLRRFMSRAPAPVAASLRALSQGNTAMPSHQREQVLAEERHRRQTIRTMAGAYLNDAALRPEIEAALEDTNMTPEVFGARMLQILGRDREPMNGGMVAESHLRGGSAAFGGGRGEQDFILASADALVVRAGLAVHNPHPGHRDFMRMDVGELARACLARAGKSARDFDRVGAIRAALSTSDFPAILSNALGKSLRQGYEEEPQSHTLWARFVQVEDFKSQLRAILSSAPDLLHVPEGGEYADGAMDDDAASYAVAKYGRIIRLTWEALVNDDLGAFIRVPQAMGQAARRKEADIAYGLFAANGGAGPLMQDGVALFDATHSNLASAVSDLDAAALSAARTTLRKQTAKGGGLMNLQPRHLIVPVELETAAEALIATSARAVAAGSDNSVLPRWIAGLQLVVEPRLADSAFYLSASSDQVDTLEIAGLQADGGRPVIEEESEFNRDAKAWKVRHVVAAAFTDWRGIVKVPVS